MIVVCKEADIPDAKVHNHNCIKQSFESRSNYPVGKTGLEQAIQNRPIYIKSIKPNAIKPPGINPYKQVELYKNFRPNIDKEFWDITCPKPSAQIMASVKAEKVDRTEMKVKKKKREADYKQNALETIEEQAEI
jgi:hypothetical protein